jgi:UDP-N-acetyl-D-glucosamine dehydrogenase
MRILVIGQGYVGLTVAVSAASTGHQVLGYDINSALIGALNSGNSHIEGISNEQLKSCVIKGAYKATSALADLDKFDVAIIAVPTPLSTDKEPDLSFLHEAVNLIQNNLKHAVLSMISTP